MKDWIDYALKLAEAYPSVSSIVVAMSLSWAPGVIWDQWFAPQNWPARKVKQYSLTLTFIMAAVVGSVCWRSLVPTDGRAMVYVVSGASAFIAPFAHMLLGSVLDHYVPWINLDGKLKKAE